MRETVIKLITEYGDGTTIQRKVTPLIGNVSSVGRQEFYQAYAVGLAPSIVVRIYSSEYDCAKAERDGVITMPNKIEIDGVEHVIIRTYQRDLDFMEITAE